MMRTIKMMAMAKIAPFVLQRSVYHFLNLSDIIWVRSEIIGGLRDLPGNIKAVLAQDDKVCLSQLKFSTPPAD